MTIRGLMGAIAVVAGGLALVRSGGWPLFVIVAADLIPAAMLWRAFRPHRRLAAWAFGTLGVATNVACVVISVYYNSFPGILLMMLGWFLTFPLTLGFGAAWASAAVGAGVVPGRSRVLIWPVVVAAAFLPVVTLFSAWPLRLAFLISRPALDRLADQVAGGMSPRFPIRAGFFSVVGSDVDSPSGSIGLVIDPNPAGRSGFVRVPPGAEGRRMGPFTNLDQDLSLGHGWWYDSED